MPSAPTPWIPNRYPATSRSDHADVYKSEERREVIIPDPYNWLEKDSEEVKKWIEAQDTFTRSYLDQNPERQELEDAIRTTMNYPVVRRVLRIHRSYWLMYAFLVLGSVLTGRQSLVLVVQQWLASAIRSARDTEVNLRLAG